MKFAAGALERLAILIASLALAVGLLALLSGFFAGRDQADIAGAGAGAGPGEAFRDLGRGPLRPGQPRPRYDSDPPTSGAHIPEPVLRDQAILNDDQVLQALELGNVVVAYGTPAPPAGLAALVRSLAPPFSPPLAAAGQAVILARRPHIAGLVGLAWAHLVHVPGPDSPQLRQFIEYWLGRGAPAP